MKNLIYGLVILIAVGFVGCGGGSSNNSTTPSTTNDNTVVNGTEALNNLPAVPQIPADK